MPVASRSWRGRLVLWFRHPHILTSTATTAWWPVAHYRVSPDLRRQAQRPVNHTSLTDDHPRRSDQLTDRLAGWWRLHDDLAGIICQSNE